MENTAHKFLSPEEFEAEFGKQTTRPGKVSAASSTEIKPLIPAIPVFEESDDIRNRVWAVRNLIRWKNRDQSQEG